MSRLQACSVNGHCVVVLLLFLSVCWKSWSKCKVNNNLQRLRGDFPVGFLLLVEITLHTHQGALALAGSRPGLPHIHTQSHTHTGMIMLTHTHSYPHSHLLPAHANILTHLLTYSPSYLLLPEPAPHSGRPHKGGRCLLPSSLAGALPRWLALA